MLPNRLEQAVLKYAKNQKELRHELRKSDKNKSLPIAVNKKNKNLRSRYSPYFDRNRETIPERRVFLKNREKNLTSNVSYRDYDEDISNKNESVHNKPTSKIIVIGDDEDEDDDDNNNYNEGRERREMKSSTLEKIGLNPGQYQVDIPGLDRENPFPLQFPDGRRYADDTERYSEEWFEKEEVRRDMLLKNKDYNFMKLFAGYIGNLSVEKLYTFRDTEVAERRRRGRLVRDQALDRLRMRQLESIFNQLPDVNQLRQLLDDTIVTLTRFTKRFEELSQDPRLEKLLPNSYEIEAINRFLSFVERWQEYFPIWIDKLENDGGPLTYDEVNNKIKYIVGTTIDRNVFKSTTTYIEELHKLVISVFLEENDQIDITVVPIYKNWARSAKVEENINKTPIELFNRALGPSMSGVPRRELEKLKNRLMTENRVLEELETERRNIQTDISNVTERQEQSAQQLILALQRQEQIQKEIEEILTRREKFNEMSIEWMDRPENSGKFEINEKAAAAINKAYAIVSGFFSDSIYDGGPRTLPLSAFMNSKIVRNQFANLAYLYYYLDGLPRRYLPASEIPQKKADVEHLLEFFRSHVVWRADSCSFLRTYNRNSLQDQLTKYTSNDIPYQPKYFSPVW